MNDLMTDITLAYQERAAKYEELIEAEMQVTYAQRALESTESAAIIAGVEGKNATERNAKLNGITHSERSRLMDCEDQAKLAKRDYELARLECSRLRLLVDAAGALS